MTGPNQATEELERRFAERTSELERQGALLEAVLRQMPAGVIVAEAPSGRLLLGNGRVDDILGHPLITPDSVRDYPAHRVRRPGGEPYEPEKLPLARALQGETITGERVEYDRGGETAILETSAAPVYSGGEIVAAVVVFNDVTARERLQRSVRDFVVNAAHEVQTPLAAIVSATEVLRAGAQDDPAERERFLEHIERQAARLTRLVRALIALARSQSGTEPPRTEIVPLRPLLDDIAAALRPAGDVTVAVECDDDVAALANADLVSQAIVNLAENAVKHTRRGRIVLRAAADGDDVVIGVADTGPGIAPEHLPHVFERFYRGDGQAGFGLGLAIVREITTAARGSVALESTPGEGTTVQIQLPGARLVT